MANGTMLHRLESLCNVDVDDVDHELIANLPFIPHNQTSNQAVITTELLKPNNLGLLRALVREYGKEGWEEVYTRAGIYFCARNIPHLSGRVLLQVSLRYVNDRKAIIRQCRSLAKAFEDAGVLHDRFAIKLPFTGAAASAAVQLNAEGIRTLATTVFSLEQAIAASQSNCLFISPYFNEIAAHFDPALRPIVKDYPLDHPMSARIIHMLETYTQAYAATGKEQPIMVIASHLNADEVFSMAELGCHHITIQGPNLKALLDTPDTLPRVATEKPKHPYAEMVTPKRLRSLSTTDALAGPTWNGIKASMNTDYVADGGAKLDEFIQSDPVVSKRFADATRFFLDAEAKAKGAIEKEIALADLS